MKVYLVFKESGEYSAWTSVVIGVFYDPKDAAKFIESQEIEVYIDLNGWASAYRYKPTDKHITLHPVRHPSTPHQAANDWFGISWNLDHADSDIPAYHIEEFEVK